MSNFCNICKFQENLYLGTLIANYIGCRNIDPKEINWKAFLYRFCEISCMYKF